MTQTADGRAAWRLWIRNAFEEVAFLSHVVKPSCCGHKCMDLILPGTVLRLFLLTPARAEADFFSKMLHGCFRRMCTLIAMIACPINEVGGIELDLRGNIASQFGAHAPSLRSGTRSTLTSTQRHR